MAPEMLSFAPRDPNAPKGSPMYSMGYGPEIDTWACGVVLHIMLCGFPPFGGRATVPQLVAQIKTTEPGFRDPAWQAMISSEARDLVKKLLMKDPKSRISAAEALKHPWMQH
eukprot:scaffold446340_cov42-Prasinocladus_malaysianus.AAC.1